MTDSIALRKLHRQLNQLQITIDDKTYRAQSFPATQELRDGQLITTGVDPKLTGVAVGAGGAAAGLGVASVGGAGIAAAGAATPPGLVVLAVLGTAAGAGFLIGAAWFGSKSLYEYLTRDRNTELNENAANELVQTRADVTALRNNNRTLRERCTQYRIDMEKLAAEKDIEIQSLSEQLSELETRLDCAESDYKDTQEALDTERQLTRDYTRLIGELHTHIVCRLDNYEGRARLAASLTQILESYRDLKQKY